MVSIGKIERLETPEEWNQMLVDLFGVNWYGDPMYRIIWGQTDVLRVSSPEGGYHDQVVGGNAPVWLLQRWVSPDKWICPDIFEMINKDPENGQPLFPYPQFGSYETIHSMGKGALEYEVIRATIPFLEELLFLSDMQVKSYRERREELKNKQQVEEITDRLMDSLPTRYGPTSYGRGGCKTSILAKKEEEIQRVWNRYRKEDLPHIRGAGRQGVTPHGIEQRS